MNANRKCPGCGTEISDDAPEGLCPACLMKAGMRTSVPTVVAEPRDRNNTFAPPPGAPLGIEEVRKLFPQLEIIEQIGRGGMGVVFKARQPQLDRLVALKILPAELAKTPGFAERFTREARALAKLNHPNIVSVFDFGQQEDLFYFIMEFVDGANLRQMIASKQMSPEEALAIVPKICEALQFAHDEGILHRDIKPENILIDKKGRVKIADFGLAKLIGADELDHGLTNTGMSMGTPRYMAPEQFENTKAVDHRADIYSLGVVFYEMLTGEIPMGRFAPPSQKVHVDVRLDEVVLKSLEKEPALRYQHVSEVKTDVESITKLGVIASPPSLPTRASETLSLPTIEPEILATAEKSLKNASVGMLVAGCLVLSWAVLGCIIDAWPMIAAKADNPAVAMRIILTLLFYTYAGILMMISSGSIKRLRFYGFNLGVCWMAMLLPLSLLFLRMDDFNRMVWGVGFGALFGFQAFRALRKPDIVAAFKAVTPPPSPAERPKSTLGRLSLWLAIVGLVLPVLLVFFFGLTSAAGSTAAPVIIGGLLVATLEATALICGIIARKSASGKAGLIIASIGTILVAQGFLALPFSKGPASGGGTLLETIGESFGVIRSTLSSKAEISEEASSYDPQSALYRTFRYRVTGPANQRATLWVEFWRNGVLEAISPGLTQGRSFQLPRGKGFDGYLEYKLGDGEKLGSDSAGKLRWDMTVESRLRNFTSRTSSTVMKIDKDDTSTTTGEWIKNPFAGIPAMSSTWGQKGRWSTAPGETVTLLILRGGDSIQSVSTSEDENIAKRHKVCLMIKARFDPIPTEEQKDWSVTTSISSYDVPKLQPRAKQSVTAPSDKLEVEQKK